MDDKIAVIVEGQPDNQRQVLGVKPSSGGLVTKALDVDQLGKSMQAFSKQINHIFDDIQQVGHFQLDSVALQVEISSEGGIALIGSLRAGVKGAVTLTFTPKPTAPGTPKTE